jgi:hypothetical protein
VYDARGGGVRQKVSIGNAGAGGVKVQSIPAVALRRFGADLLPPRMAALTSTWTGSAWRRFALDGRLRATWTLQGWAQQGRRRFTDRATGQAYLFEWVPPRRTT